MAAVPVIFQEALNVSSSMTGMGDDVFLASVERVGLVLNLLKIRNLRAVRRRSAMTSP